MAAHSSINLVASISTVTFEAQRVGVALKASVGDVRHKVIASQWAPAYPKLVRPQLTAERGGIPVLHGVH